VYRKLQERSPLDRSAPAQESGAVRVRTGKAEVWLRDEGIVHVRVFPHARQSVADAEQNLEAARSLCGGQRRPVLVDITGCEPLEPQVRRCYTGDALKPFSAIAMLVDATTFGRMIGNIYLQIATAGVPTRLFQGERESVAWLSEHV
jgi:hypothetical protein